MDKAVLQQTLAVFDSLDALKMAHVPAGRFSVTIDSGKFECLFIANPVDRLFVILHGARDPRNHPLPVFQRWSWHELFPGSVLCVSDPTLFLDPERMRLGWYVGTQCVDYLAALARLVSTVANMILVPSERIIAYGSSGGGFAALMVASQIEGSTAVSINAQTNVLKYMKKFVDNLLGLAFGGRGPGELTAEELLRMDAVEAFSRTRTSKCLYVQNVQDVAHYKRHFLPFCHATGAPSEGGVSQDGRIIAYLYDDVNGHGAEPKALVPTLITLALGLADGRSQQEMVDLVTQSRAALVDKGGSLWGEGELAQRVDRAIRSMAWDIEDLPKEALYALVLGVFDRIRQEIANTGDGVLRVPDLGTFRVRQLKSGRAAEMSGGKRIWYMPNSSKGRTTI